MVKYIVISDLIENGENCSTYQKRPDDEYIILVEDSRENCGRGRSTFFYKKEIICSEMMKRSKLGINLDGASIGLYKAAQKWAIKKFKKQSPERKSKRI